MPGAVLVPSRGCELEHGGLGGLRTAAGGISHPARAVRACQAPAQHLGEPGTSMVQPYDARAAVEF